MKTSLNAFTRPWAKLCAAHPRYEIGEATLTVYHERLCKFSVEQIMAAVDTEIDNNKYFPSPAELIENIRAQVVTGGLKQIAEPTRPTREEAQVMLEQLHIAIRKFESEDQKKRAKQIAARKLQLQDQARKLAKG